MSTIKFQRGNVIQVVGILLFFIWIAGAIVAGMYHNYVQKRQCIQDEGWLKGWFWCSTETQDPFVGNMLRGTIWPIDLAIWLNRDPIHGNLAELGPNAEATALGTGQLTRTDRDLIEKRCAEAIETENRRVPDAPKFPTDLCIHGHQQAALNGQPSFLTMTASEYEHYEESRELTQQEKESLLKKYDGLAKTCSSLALKTMAVQPLAKDKLKQETITPQEMAVLVTDWKPQIPDTSNVLYQAALASHFKEAGLYGKTLAYFLDQFDRCVELSASVQGLLREKDRRSEAITQTTNTYRAKLAEMFSDSQGLRDQIYGKD